MINILLLLTVLSVQNDLWIASKSVELFMLKVDQYRPTLG